jgi:2-methylisocitrate lyase-like PEP mutase family enzyme
MTDTRAWLRHRSTNGPLLTVPGAANALTARVIEDTGFEACYVTGAGIANTYLGVPDIGLVSLNELAQHVAAIRAAVAIPLIVDADTGFGNPLSVQHTVRVLERAGADAIQIEDQASPKRCGHFKGKEVISASQMEQKLRAALDARNDPDLLIIARTDARSTEGYEAALDRARRYADVGADITFLEAPTSEQELLDIPHRLPGTPQVVNLVEGGQTPPLPTEQLSDFRIALFANAALQAQIHGMQEALRVIHAHGSLAELTGLLAPWTERQRLVGKPHFDELEERYRNNAE